jgi:hypothetical protein
MGLLFVTSFRWFFIEITIIAPAAMKGTGIILTFQFYKKQVNTFLAAGPCSALYFVLNT